MPPKCLVGKRLIARVNNTQSSRFADLNFRFIGSRRQSGRTEKFDRGRDLVLAAALLLAALYTKYNIAFIVVPLLLTLIVAGSWSPLRDRRLWWIGGAVAIGARPAIGLLFTFGSANLQSAADLSGEVPRWSVAAWSFYPALLP